MTLRSKYDDAMKQISSLNAQISALNVQIAQLKTDLEASEAESAAKDATIAQLRQDKTGLTAQLAAEKAHSADLQAQLDALQPQPPKGGCQLGAWAEFGGDGNSSLAEQAQFDTLSGTPMAISMMYAPFSAGGAAYNFAPSTGIYDAGRWPHWAWGNPPTGTNLATWIPDIAAGKYDALLTQTAKNIVAVAQGRRFQLRPFWEMNGQWQEWNASKYGSNDAAVAKYRAAWVRLAQIFRAEAPKVELVWSPAWDSLPNDAWNVMGNYYPGDAYVDRIGVEPYCNYGFDTQIWRSFQQLCAETVTFAAGRPMMMTEGGCAQDPRKAQWITDMRAYVKTLPNFKELLYFHRPAVTKEGGKDFRVDTDPNSLAAWKALCADPYFKKA